MGMVALLDRTQPGEFTGATEAIGNGPFIDQAGLIPSPIANHQLIDKI